MSAKATREEMEELLQAVLEALSGRLVEASKREVCYLLSARGIIPKTERAFANMTRNIREWQRAGRIPWGSFTEGGRDLTEWRVHRSITEAMESAIANYARDPWQDQATHVEVWVEKGGAMPNIVEAARPYLVTLMEARGGAADEALYSASRRLRRVLDAGKEVRIAWVGDFDAHGVLFDPAAERMLREIFGLDQFDGFKGIERIAVTRALIGKYDIQTRPSKVETKKGDRYIVGERFAKEQGESADIEAVPQQLMRDLVAGWIRTYVRTEAWERSRRKQERERGQARRFLLENWKGYAIKWSTNALRTPEEGR